MAAQNNVTAEVIVRLGGHEVAAGSFEIPLHVTGPDEHGNAVVTIPEAAAFEGFRTLALEMAEALA